MVVPASVRAHALAVTVLDPPELLDIDVDQLPGTLALVALGGLQPQPAEFAYPDLSQDPRDGREGHPENLGNLSSGQTHTTWCRDRSDALLTCAVRDSQRAEERSSRPNEPSARQRASHLRAVRSLRNYT